MSNFLALVKCGLMTCEWQPCVASTWETTGKKNSSALPLEPRDRPCIVRPQRGPSVHPAKHTATLWPPNTCVLGPEGQPKGLNLWCWISIPTTLLPVGLDIHLLQEVSLSHLFNTPSRTSTFGLSKAGRPRRGNACQWGRRGLRGALMDTQTILTWAMTSEMDAHPTRKLYLCFRRMPAWVHACRKEKNLAWETPLGLDDLWLLWFTGHSGNRLSTFPPSSEPSEHRTNFALAKWL